jgi:hypothetical protein
MLPPRVPEVTANPVIHQGAVNRGAPWRVDATACRDARRRK